MHKPIAQILEEASKLPRKERAQYLRDHQSVPMMIILQYALHPAVKWLLPEGEVPYKPTKTWDDQDSHIYREAKKLYYFIEGGYPGHISRVKLETMFIQILESVHQKDAELLVAAKDKKLPYEGITPEIVREAFPGILP